MTVAELLETIKGLPPTMEVILQKDAEGNGYSPLSGADPECIYKADSTWSGEVYATTWTNEEAGHTPEDWEALLASPRCLVLYPVN